MGAVTGTLACLGVPAETERNIDKTHGEDAMRNELIKPFASRLDFYNTGFACTAKA